MKTKFLFAALLAAGFIMWGFSSCKKELEEPPLNLSIIGKWNFTSFKLDNEEYLGTQINSAFIDYKIASGGKTQFTQSVTFSNGNEDIIHGEYDVNPNTKSVTMTTESKIITSTINIKDDLMEWVSSQDGKPLIIKAMKEK